ncbi:MAG: AMP-binding protein [Bdellovibrionota bacterium]
MANLHATIFGLCSPRGNAPAFRLQREAGGYRAVGWKDLREQALKFCSYLKSQGVGAGDRVVLVSENGPEWGIAALAVFNLEAILVPVASIASPVEIINTIRSAAPKFSILSTRIISAKATEEMLKAEFPKYITWDLQTEKPLKSWIENQAPAEIRNETPENQIAILIYTSGTTGQPKGVPISHGNVLANAEAVKKRIAVSGKDRVVSVLPLSHMLEFTGGFVITSLVGATVTYIKTLKPEDLLKALRDSKATVVIGVPLLFEVIARNLQQKLDAMPPPLPEIFGRFAEITFAAPRLGRWLFYPIHRALGGHIRFFVAGGSRLQPQVFDFYKGIGIYVLQGYGLTETAPVLALTSVETAGADHVGKALPGVEIGIFSNEGMKLPAEIEGEIWAKGPNIFSGYLDPAHNKDVFFNGWFRTGDLGKLDNEGILRITGRKKDIIVTGAGKNVYPEEIESLVLESGHYLEVAVLGMPDAGGHEKVTLVAVPDRVKFLGKSTDEIRDVAATEISKITRALSEYKWPQRIEVLFDELPKTSTRKIKKHEVKKLLVEREHARLAERQSAGSSALGLNLNNEIERAIAEGIEGINKMDPASVQPNHSLQKDIGLDSLTFVELVSQIERKFDLQLEGVDFATIHVVQDLVQVIEEAEAHKKKATKRKSVKFSEFIPSENGRLSWRIPRRFINFLFRALFKFRYHLEVEGLENLNSGGPFVFTPNHSSHADMIAIATSTPLSMLHRTYAVAAKDYFFGKWWMALGSRIMVNALPFDRKARVDESMRLCRYALDEGGSLVIFPEGTRSPTGNIQEFKTGVGRLLAGNPTAMAVPVYIDGAYAIMPKGSNFPGPGKLRVRYGKPITFAAMEPGPESNRQIADQLRAEVIALSKL